MADLSWTGYPRQQLVAGLAAVLCHGSGVEVTAEHIDAAAAASKNELAGYWGPLFASVAEKAGGLDKMFPGAGGGGGGAVASSSGGASSNAPVVEAPKEEEVDALEGGMDMFGGGESDY